MKKYIPLILLVAVIGFIGWTCAKPYLDKAAQVNTDTTAPPTATQPLTVLEKMGNEIGDLDKAVTSLKTSDQVLSSKLDQIQTILTQIQKDIQALKE